MREIEQIISSFNTSKYILDVEPVAKPRMTQRDRWSKRPATTKYWKFKDAVKLEMKRNKLKGLPGFIPMIIFYIKTPDSISINGKRKNIKAKKDLYESEPVEVRPDVDNYIKSLLDCIESEDNFIHTICASKRYSQNPRIEIYIEK